MRYNKFLSLILSITLLLTMCFSNMVVLAGDTDSEGTVIDFSQSDIISASGLTKDTSVKYGNETQSARFKTGFFTSDINSEPVVFTNFDIESNWQKVRTICLRIYNKNSNNDVLNIVFNQNTTDDLSKGYFMYKLTLNWTGWKTIKVPVSSFTPVNGAASWKNIKSFFVNLGGWGNSSPKYNTQVNFSSVYGLTADTNNKQAVIDYNEVAIIDVADMERSTEIVTGINKQSAKLTSDGNKVATTAIPFEDYVISEDWSECTHICVDMYNKNANGETVNLVFNSSKDNSVSGGYYIGKVTLDFTGWKTIKLKKSDFTAVNGISSWSDIKSMFIDIGGFDGDVKNNTEIYLSRIYGVTEENDVENTFVGATGIYCGVSDILENNTLTDTGFTAEYKDEKIFIPAQMLEKVISGAEVSLSDTKATLTYSGATYVFTENSTKCEKDSAVEGIKFAPYKKNGSLYISAEDLFRVLNVPCYIYGRLILTGDESLIESIKNKTNHNLNTYAEDVIKIICADTEKALSGVDCDAVLEKWKLMLIGENNDLSNRFVKAEVNERNSYANEILGKIVKNSTSSLFNDISCTSTGEMTRMFKRVYNLALAYGTPECTLYQDAELKTEIIYCLDWLCENVYGQNEINGTGWRSVDSYNWWDWSIGVPSYLVPTLIIMSDNLSAEKKSEYLYLFDEISNDVKGSGANFSETAKYMLGSAALKGDYTKVTYFRNKISDLYFNVDDARWTESQLYGDRTAYIRVKGSGFHSDGSYIFHTLHPMNGAYGAEQFMNMAEFIYMFEGTNGEFPKYQTDAVYDLFKNAFDSLMYNNSIMRFVLGRGENPSQIFCTHLAAMVKCLDKFNEYEREYIEDRIRKFAENGNDTLYQSLDINDIKIVNNVLSGTTSTAVDESISKVFYNMDKVVHRRSDWAVGLSMSSSRIFNYESINNANKKGWYLSDGRTEIYLENEGNSSYENYWKDLDDYRLPGTTVDTQERASVSIAQGNEYLSSKDFVGGVTLDNKYSVAAMDLESYHNSSDFGIDGGSYGGKAPAHTSDLVAKKSYFMFDDAVYCLGTGITETNAPDAKVLTIVDNRIADGKIYSDASEIAVSSEVDFSDATTLNINNKIGYYFPEYTDENKGSVKAEKTSAGYVQLYFDHGTNPTDASYAYALLPNMTAEETKAYSENSKVEILANNEAVQCVRNTESGITGIVFWEAGTYEGITVSEPMMVMVQETGNKYKIAVSDPTQKLTNASLSVDKLFEGYVCDDELSVEEYNDVTKLNIDFSSIDGRSLEAELYSTPNNYFSFNDEQLAKKYVNDNGESVLSKMTLNSDDDYTYGNAMYSGLIDLSNGNKYGTEKASLEKMGMTTDWSGYDILRVRYYSTVQDAYYSIFLSDTTSQTNRYRFTVYADKVGWNVAEIDFNALKKNGSPSLSNINYIQIRTDNNSDSTGGSSHKVGSGATSGLKFYFDKMWLEKYEEAGERSYISFVDNAATVANWITASGTAGNGKLQTAGGGFYGAPYSCYIDLSNGNKWGTNQGSIAALGMKTDWTEYDTLNLRFKSNTANKFFTIFLWCNDAYSVGYKVKITARKGDWYTAEIPLSSLTAKNNPNLNSIKYIQIRTDNNTDGGQQCGSGATSGWKIYFDKLWLTQTEAEKGRDFTYVYSNNEATITGIDTLSPEGQANMVIPDEIDGYTVTKIGKNAFKNNSNIIKVTLPKTLKMIDNDAFSGCVNLSEVIWNEGLEVISSLSFYNTKIKDFVAPTTLELIGPNAFRTCNYLTKIILSPGITKISDYAFYRCSNIDGIYFPQEIPQSAYGNYLVGGFDTFTTVRALGENGSYIKELAKTAVDSEEGGSRNMLYKFEQVFDGIITFENSFKFASGEELTGDLADLANCDGSIGYNTEVYNVSEADKEIYAICAVYNNAGALCGADFVNKTVPSRQFVNVYNTETDVTVNNNIDSGYSVKGMLFDSLSNIRPYTDAVAITIK